MRKLTFVRNRTKFTLFRSTIFVWLMVMATHVQSWSQCTPESQTISGTVFEDKSNDGTFRSTESGLANVLITAYDDNGNAVGSSVSDINGYYTIADLDDGNSYRLQFESSGSFYSSKIGYDSRSSVQFIDAPSCNVNYGLTRAISSCGSNPDLILTCFVQGETNENPDFETIISVEHDFNVASAPYKLATMSETGSVWGIAQDVINQNIFTSSFVKQYSGLKYGPYAILKTELEGAKKTTLFAEINSLIPQSLPGLAVTDVHDCAYGNQVGRVGLGNLIISPDSKTLYTSILDENLVVGVSVMNPDPSTTDVFQMPRPSGIDANEEYRIFALEWHEGLIYVGGTVTGSYSEDRTKTMAVIMTLDPETGTTSEIFRTSYLKGYWQDDKPASLAVSQWFTDISFNSFGEIIVSFSDRIGHRYCKEATNRLDQQFPDILVVAFNPISQEWELEDNGFVAGREGSGSGNNEGPGGGEFFGFDHWPTNPTYHNETALGSTFILPGSDQVIVSVYDPLINSYSGGLQRYSTIDGAKLGAVELYSHAIFPVFGKATGFGDIVARCEVETIEIGNYVWNDINGNGLQDASENGIPNLVLNLYDVDCNLVGTTTTDENGIYVFNSSNVDNDQNGTLDGVYPNTTYYVELDNSIFNPLTGLYTVGNNEFTICTANAGSDEDDMIDCDAEYNEAACLDQSFIVVNTSETNHTFDIALGEPSGFDLALKKEILGNKFAVVGEDILFKISVYNQGGHSASEVTIADYLPTGYSFNPEQNQGWDQEGDLLTTKITQRILPGTSVSTTLRLQVSSSQAANYVNVAEISEALTLAGDVASDVDSTPDVDNTNDNGGEPFTSTDDQINGTGIIDEDDHDPAIPSIFDLAVRITLADNKFYYADDLVKFDIKLYNQGNVDADLVKLANYFPKDLIFNTELNPLWTEEGDYVVLTDETILAAGEIRDYCIYFNIAKLNVLLELVDFIEIAASSPVDHPGSFDFDSTPDTDKTNDVGGEIYTSKDNYVDDHGEIDEDDHDPVVVKTQYVDLALMKTTSSRNVKAGDQVDFEIEVINQGDAPAYIFTIIDYLPEGMTLVSPEWELQAPGLASRTVILDSPLNKGEKTKVNISTRVDDNVTPKALVNYAEIASVKDENGAEIGAKDIDSTPDELNNNDNGGEPDTDTDNSITSDRYIDEDDHDPAKVIVISKELVSSECLENATNNTNGQFEDVYKITGPRDHAWYVFSATNYYDESSPEPGEGALVPLAIGEMATLDTMPMSDGLMMYSITVIREDGQVGNIVFRSNKDDVETFTSPMESYDNISLIGNTALCNGGVEEYCIIDPVPNTAYNWSVSDAGAIITLDGNLNTCVTIDWNGVATDATYELTAEADEGCIAPKSLNVAIGTSAGALSCLGHMNISLNSICEVVVTPGLILTSTINVGEAYSVMLTTESGEVIPNATLTADHIGTTVTAKVIDGCSGNSCWSTILVEDKLKPTIECIDVEIACNKIDEFEGPFAQDNCGNPIAVELLSETTETLSCETYVARITRTYQATDAQGNKSDVCEMNLLVEQVELDDIVFPDNLLMINNTALNCDAYDLDMDGVADLDITGVPIYNNEYVYPEFEQFCNAAITFEDEKRTIGGVLKITRKWTAWKWYCSVSESRTHYQYIEILDTEPPVITCPNDISVSAVSGNCQGSTTLPLPQIMDECSDNVTVTIKPPFGALIEEGDSRFVSFPLVGSPHTVEYTATDESGNRAKCSITVTVTDNIAPVAICDQNSIVGLNSDGLGYAYALNIDDGSYDACGLEEIEIRRMDVGGAYADKVLFDCDDVGDTIVVELKVTDKGGLSNTCTANVVVQDKHAPVVSAPANQVIECGDSFTPLSQFGDFTFNDACEVTTSMDSIFAITECGTGTITRMFIAMDNDGADTAYQTITIINNDPFDGHSIVFPKDTLITVNSCSVGDVTDPENLLPGFNYPTFTDDLCDMVTAGKHDDIFTLINDPDNICFKIRRTWTVADWCQKDSNGNPAEWTGQQVISVINEKEPDTIVVSPLLDTITTASCDEALVEFNASSNDCNPDVLQYTVNVDFDNDFLTTNVYDLTYSGVGGSYDFSQLLPIGNHTIVVTFQNPCGNSTTTSFPILIQSERGPNILCQATTIAVSPWDTTGDGNADTEGACIDVNTLLDPSGTNHPCGTDIQGSFSSETIVTEMCFECSELGINDITVYVIDENGNFASCETTVTVEDNNDVDICIGVKDCVNAIADTTLSLTSNCVFTVNGTGLDIAMINNECGDLTITHDFPGIPNVSLNGAQFPLGMTMVTWTISNGQTAETCKTIFNVIDEISPLIGCASGGAFTVDVSSGCTYTEDSSDLDPTVSDNCMVASITHNYTSAPSNTTLSGATFPLGDTEVIFTATDAAGNSSTCTLTVTVNDNGNPMLTCASNTTFPDSFDGDSGCSHTMAGTGLDPIISSDECTAVTLSHDFDDAPLTTTLAGAEFPLGTTTVTFTATDEAGNTATCEINVTVEDNIDPTVTCPTDPIVNENADGVLDCEYLHTTNSLNPTIFDDNCNDEIAVSLTHNYTSAPSNTTLNGATFPVGVTNVIWTVTDGAGNTNSCDMDITVLDTNSPECIDQGIIDLIIGGDQEVVLSESLLTTQYTDACGIANVVFSPATLDCEPIGEVDVEVTVTDNNMNTSVCMVTFNVIADLNVTCELVIDTIFLNDIGEGSFNIDDAVNVTGGGCGVTNDVTVSQSSFDCSDLASSPITITIFVNDEECNTGELVIIDNIAPVIDCVDNTTFNDTADSAEDCQHTVQNTDLDPSASEACGPVTFVHNIAGAPSQSSLEGAVFSEDGSPHLITWTVTDASGNTTQCSYTITVVDNVDPTCVDQGTINIELDAGDSVDLTEDLLINPFTDNCGVASVTFEPTSVDCTNGGTVNATATVTDINGNDSECPVVFNVIVNDDVSCSFNIDTIYLDENGEVFILPEMVDVNGGICGTAPEVTFDIGFAGCNDVANSPITISIFTNGMLCGVDSLMVIDTFPPEIFCSTNSISCIDFENNFNGDVDQYLLSISTLMNDVGALDSLNENCETLLEFETSIDSSGLNECSYGEILITIIANDPASGMSDTCVQQVIIEGPANELEQGELDAILTDTVTVLGCTDGDFNIDTITNADLAGLVDCGLFNISFEDVSANSGCPDTITRTYTIEAICQEETLTTTQIVILNDDEAPVLATVPVDLSIAVNHDDCLGVLDLTGLIEATDNCSAASDIDITYDFDGSGDLDVNTISNLEVGEYMVTVTASDGCSNMVDSIFALSVQDTVENSILGTKIIVYLEAPDGTYDVGVTEALQIDLNCSTDLLYTYDEDDYLDTIRTVTCADIEDFKSFDVFVFEIDIAGDTIPFDVLPDVPGLENLIKVQVETRDTLDLCMTSNITVGGNVTTVEGVGIPDYRISLYGSGTDPIMSDEFGQYAFSNMPVGGNYSLGTFNNNDVMNGVTTLDLIMIQRHILGLQEFDSPYKYIAADINNSETVTGSDLLALRKMILGINIEFPNNNSWRAIDAQHEFEDEKNPWSRPLPEVYDIINLSNNMYVDFYGIKIGDINGNVTLGLQEGEVSTSRSDKAKVLYLETEGGQTEVYTDEQLNIAGLQFTINTGDMTIMDISSDYFDQNHIGFFEVEDGIYNVSIANSSAINIEEGSALFRLEYDCTDCKDGAVLQFKSSMTAEVYLNDNFDVTPLELENRNKSNDRTSFVVSQNTPNPWNGYTNINVNMNVADDVRIAVYDVNGRLVYRSKLSLSIGENVINLEDDNVPGSGVYFYEISTNDQTARFKMIKLK